jgi:hypothetical protein
MANNIVAELAAGRSIIGLWWSNGGEVLVSEDHAKSIDISWENGQNAPVLWFVVTFHDGNIYHYNSAHVEGVRIQ